MTISRVAVLGAGTMGHGIAHAAAASGYEARVFDVSADALSGAARAIETVVRRGVELGKVTAADADAILGRLQTTTDLAEAVADADFVIEAAPERHGPQAPAVR